MSGQVILKDVNWHSSKDMRVHAFEEPTGWVLTLGRAEIFTYRDALTELAAHSDEANAFYAPTLLEPALTHLAEGLDLSFVLVFDWSATGEKRLCGFFPFERMRNWHGLPIQHWRLWQHLHCFFCAPLIRAGCSCVVLQQLLLWAAQQTNGAQLLEFQAISAAGPFATGLTKALATQRRSHWHTRRYERAFFTPAASAADYLEATVSGKHRKEWRRLRRQLALKGDLELRVLAQNADAKPWIADFLRVEMSGWKGLEGSAMLCDAHEQAFFTDAALAAQAGGQFMMMGLYLNGQAIAMKCNFRAAQGAFCFKIAFDPAYADYSPGILLELDHIELAHHTPHLEWLDSCAKPGHPMINRLWSQRRAMQDLTISNGHGLANLLLLVTPPLLQVKRGLSNLFRRLRCRLVHC